VDAPAIGNGFAQPGLPVVWKHLSSFRLRCTLNPVGTVERMGGHPLPRQLPGRLRGHGSTPGIGFIIRGDASWTMFLSAVSVNCPRRGAVAADYTLDVEVRENVMRATLNGQVLSVGCGDTAYVLPPPRTAN